jgi:hypothetical protein
MKIRWALVASWLVSTALIGVALFSTPYMRKVLRGEAVEGPVSSVLFFVLGALVTTGWPWLAAQSWSSVPGGAVRQIVFGLSSVVLASVLTYPIATQPDAGAGANIILYILLVWVACFLVRPRSPKGD